MTVANPINKWKIAFFSGLLCSFVAFFAVCSSAFDKILDMGITNSYMQDGYEDTEEDLKELMKIINHTDLSKTQIKQQLVNHEFVEFMDFNKDDIRLNRIVLHFENDKLVKVDEDYHW